MSATEFFQRIATPATQRWQQLPQRDQRALQIMALILLPALLYFALFFPLQKARARLQTQLPELEQQLQYMQQSAQTLRALQGTGVGNERGGRTLMQVSSESAQQRELNIARMQPRSAGELQIWLDDVAYDQLLGWIYDLETRYGVQVAVANISAGDSPGIVRVTLKLKDNAA